MTEEQAEFMTEIIAVFSTVLVETCKSMSKQSGGTISRHLVALEIERSAKIVPAALPHAPLAVQILSSIAAQLDDKPFNPVHVKPTA